MAAVDLEHLPVHIGRCVTAQEDDDARDVGGVSQPASRVGLSQAALDVRGHVGGGRGGEDEPGGDRVGPDAVRP